MTTITTANYTAMSAAELGNMIEAGEYAQVGVLISHYYREPFAQENAETVYAGASTEQILLKDGDLYSVEVVKEVAILGNVTDMEMRSMMFKFLEDNAGEEDTLFRMEQSIKLTQEQLGTVNEGA